MIKKNIFKIFLLVTLIQFNNLYGESNYFDQGKFLFEKKDYIKAKFKFEQDIVYNPKSENSYLFLAKIYNHEKKKNLEENNLNTVILLNPKNEFAVHDLIKLKIEKSDFSKAESLITNFKLICKDLCDKVSNLKNDIKNLSKK